MKAYTDAIKSYESAILANGHFVPAYINLAQLYRILKNSVLEDKTLLNGVRSNPKEIVPYLAAAESYVRQGSADRVPILFDGLRSATDNSATALLAIADFYP